MKRLLPLLLFAFSITVFAQEQQTTATSASPSDPFEAQLIPRNSKVYIAPFKSENAEKPVEGFETYMAAAMRKKNVPLIMVGDRSQADFEIVGSADKKGAGFAKSGCLATGAQQLPHLSPSRTYIPGW